MPAAIGSAFAIALLSLGLTAQAVAANADNSLSDLRAYAQSIASPTDQPQSKTNDAVYGALRDFARQVGDEQPPSIKDAPIKVAADSLFEAIQQGFQGQNGTMPVTPAAPTTNQYTPAPNAHHVGPTVCLRCHTSQAKLFEHTLMGRLMKQGKLDCETCHGPGSEHARLGGGRGVGGILSYEADDPRSSEEKNAVCLGCHERGDRANWRGSNHQVRGLACVNCHTIMKAVSRKFQLKTAFEPDTCFQCHKDRRAQMFRSAHMPMREGKVVCSNCHNPHGSFTEALLRGSSINEVCYKCHAEKRGPFLFEHEPVRENCLNCHDPHGSVNMYMLKMQRPRLCNECHSLMDFNASAKGGGNIGHAYGQSCQNCHTRVHGSNSPGGAFLFR
jgi:DmsE family decaheme c-type cytochrome